MSSPGTGPGSSLAVLGAADRRARAFVRQASARASRAPSDTILIAAVTLWALNYSVVKFGISEFKPLALPALRFGVAGLVFLAMLRLREGSIGVEWRDLPLLLVGGFFGVTMSQVTFVYALTYTSASDNALLGATAPIVTAVIATLAGLERSSARHWAAVLAGLGGVVLIVAGSPEASIGRSGLLGDALAFGNVVASSLSAVLVVPLLVRYSVFRVLTYEMLLGTAILAPIAAPSVLSQDLSRVTPAGWAALAYAVFLTGVVTNLLYFTAIGRIGPSRAAVYQYLQAFLGVMFAILLLAEAVTLAQVVGGAIVVASVVLTRLSRARRGGG